MWYSILRYVLEERAHLSKWGRFYLSFPEMAAAASKFMVGERRGRGRDSLVRSCTSYRDNIDFPKPNGFNRKKPTYNSTVCKGASHPSLQCINLEVKKRKIRGHDLALGGKVFSAAISWSLKRDLGKEEVEQRRTFVFQLGLVIAFSSSSPLLLFTPLFFC